MNISITFRSQLQRGGPAWPARAAHKAKE